MSELDRERDERLFAEIQILHDELPKVYYEPDSEATPKENVSDFGEIFKQKERLLIKD